jgi:hypothetical protein
MTAESLTLRVKAQKREKTKPLLPEHKAPSRKTTQLRLWSCVVKGEKSTSDRAMLGRLVVREKVPVTSRVHGAGHP